MGKEIPVQAWIVPPGSRSLRLTEGGKVVSPKHWPTSPPPLQKIPLVLIVITGGVEGLSQ